MYKLLVADDEQKDRNIVRLLVEKQYGDLFEILEVQKRHPGSRDPAE